MSEKEENKKVIKTKDSRSATELNRKPKKRVSGKTASKKPNAKTTIADVVNDDALVDSSSNIETFADISYVENPDIDASKIDSDDVIVTQNEINTSISQPIKRGRALAFGKNVMGIILDATLDTYLQGGTDVIHDFIDRFNEFGFASGYRQVPLFFDAYPDERFSEQIVKAKPRTKKMTVEELEKVSEELSQELANTIVAMSSLLTYQSTRTGDTYCGFVGSTPCYRKYGRPADLSYFDPRITDFPRGQLWIHAPSGGGKSTALRNVLDESTGIIIRYGEPNQADFDDQPNVVHVASLHALVTISAFLSFLGLDHGIDSARLWYASLTGPAVTKGLTADLPLAFTNWNNLTASIGAGTPIIVLNPAFGSDAVDDKVSDEIITAIYQVCRGSTAGTIRLKNYKVDAMDVRTKADGRIIVSNGSTAGPTSEAVVPSTNVTDIPSRTESDASTLGDEIADFADADYFEVQDDERRERIDTSDDIASIYSYNSMK